MSQLITTYSLNDLEDPLSMDRDEFYENQIKIFHDTSRPTRAAEVVDLILFTPKKEMILQHRAEHKLENA